MTSARSVQPGIVLFNRDGFRISSVDEKLVIEKERADWWNLALGSVFLILWPLVCFVAIASGIWLIARGIPANASARDIMIAVAMSVFFIGAGTLLLLWGGPALYRAHFSERLTFESVADREWQVRRRLGWLPLPRRTLRSPLRIVVEPCGSRGDWGYSVLIRAANGRMRVLIPTVVGSNRRAAGNRGREAANAIAQCLNVEMEWDPRWSFRPMKRHSRQPSGR